MSSYRHETGSEELEIDTDPVLQIVEDVDMDNEQETGGIVSSSVENFVEYGVFLFFFIDPTFRCEHTLHIHHFHRVSSKLSSLS